jgi:transcriptional pleiotropic regulator of transition state genes
MTKTGIARQLDAVGRITLPKELRKTMNFAEREVLEIYTEEDKIILKKCSNPTDIFTGSTENLIEYKGRLVSKESIVELSRLAGLI